MQTARSVFLGGVLLCGVLACSGRAVRDGARASAGADMAGASSTAGANTGGGAGASETDAGAADENRDTMAPEGRLLLNQQVDWPFVDDSRLYWLTDPAGLSGCEKENCAATVMQFSSDDTNFPSIGKDHLYFIIGDETVTCPKTGCAVPPSRMGVRADWPSADGDYLYFHDGRGIVRCPFTGCTNPTESVAPMEGPPILTQLHPIRFYGAYAYWASATGIRRVLKDGTKQAETLVPPMGQQAIDVTRHGIYWLDASAHVFSCPLAGCGDLAATEVCTSDAPKFAFYADDSGLYWKESGAVHFCASSGCGSTSRVLTNTNVVQFVVDDRFVYWNHGPDAESAPIGTGIGTTIRRVLKPAE